MFCSYRRREKLSDAYVPQGKMQYLILFLLLLISVPTFACDCKIIEDLPAAQRQEFTSRDLVFVGEVISVNLNSGTYQLKVVEFFKGSPKQKIISGKAMTDCSKLPSKEGELWLIYANVLADGIIHISDCGLSRSYSFPYAFNEEISVPAPPRPGLKDKSIDVLEWEIANSAHHQKALKILKNEIGQLRKWKLKGKL